MKEALEAILFALVAAKHISKQINNQALEIAVNEALEGVTTIEEAIEYLREKMQ